MTRLTLSALLLIAGVQTSLAESWIDDRGGILFASERDGETTNLYLADASGDNVCLVTNRDRSEARFVGPRWRGNGSLEIHWFYPETDADGTIVAYQPGGFSLNASSVVHTRNQPATDQRASLSHTIPAVAAFHANSGDGFHIFLTEHGSADTMRLGQSGFHPEWSPNSQTIAFLSDRHGWVEIFAVDQEGDNLVRLAPGVLAHRPMWAWPGGHDAIESTDAGYLAFLGSRDSDGRLDVYVVRGDGAGLMNVSKDPIGVDVFSWSPDGRRIAFASRRDGNREIYVVNIDGSGLTNVTNHPSEDLTFSWVAQSTAQKLLEAGARTEEELRSKMDPRFGIFTD